MRADQRPAGQQDPSVLTIIRRLSHHVPFPNMLTFGQDLHSDQIMMEDVKSMSGGTQRCVRKRITGETEQEAVRPGVWWERRPFKSVSRTQIEGHLKGESNGVECMCTSPLR